MFKIIIKNRDSLYKKPKKIKRTKLKEKKI